MEDGEGLDLNDPHPSIHDLFRYYNDIYFEGKLGACSVTWSSKRMTLCAGVCHFNFHSGCDIRLSEPLLKFRPVSDLKNTLLHEMIHAYLFLTNGNDDHDDHGPKFQEMMALVNDCCLADEERPEDGYAVTIYHNFSREVDSYRGHQWRCPNCADLIRRAMNRTPSASDCYTRCADCSHPNCHWHTHIKRCGGIYEKIHEPEGYVDKRKRAAMSATADGSKLNEQFVDKGDANLTRNGQKRKVVMDNEGKSKKAAKGSPLPLRFIPLEDYFCKDKKDERTSAYAQRANADDTDLGEKGVNGPSVNSAMAFSPVDIFRGKKLYLSDDAAQKETVHDTTDGCNAVRLEQGSSSTENFEGRLSRMAADTEVEETSKETRTIDLCQIISSPPSRTNFKRLNPRNLIASKEASTSSPYLSTRKRPRTADLLSKVHSHRDPLVILAWRNWVSYESDEDCEEPLINKRTERRKKEWEGDTCDRPEPEPEPGKDVALQCKSDCAKEMSSGYVQRKNCEDDTGAQELPVNAHGEMSERTLLGDTVIELSDDEGRMEGREEEHLQIEQQILEHPGQVSGGRTNWDFHRDQSGREAPETHAGLHLSLGQVLQAQCESVIPSDVMRCPICNYKFQGNEDNAVVNEHIDVCLGQTS